MIVLGIESSCDETAAAVVRDGHEVLASVVASQVDVHARYGGVVPEIAARSHLDQLDSLIARALDEAGLGFEDLAGIAATGGIAAQMTRALRTLPDAEIVAVIDSDYEVHPRWLRDLAPQLLREKVAIMQAPQDYRDAHENAFKAMCYAEYRGFFYIGMITRNERNAIIQHGTDRQREKYVKPLLQGDIFAAECLTEPRGGSDFFGTTTTAVRQGDDYILNGQKRFIVGAEGADYFLVYAKTDPAAKPHEALTCFIVDRGPGVETRYLYNLMGCRGGGAGRLVFKDVRVPAENIVGQLNNAYAVFNTMMIPERRGTAARLRAGPCSWRWRQPHAAMASGANSR